MYTTWRGDGLAFEAKAMQRRDGGGREQLPCFTRGYAGAFLTAAMLILSSVRLQAANITWQGTTNNDWGLATNWVGGIVPGQTVDSTNRDAAWFSKGSGYQWTVIPDTGRVIGSITFFQTAPGNAGNYTIGAPGGTPLSLAGAGSGSMQVDSTLTTSNVTETVAVPVVLYSSYAFNNYSPTPSTTLHLDGSIYSGTNANVQIQLKGTNLGANTISGVISNGASSVSIAKPQGGSSLGTWVLAAANTYTGSTVVYAGTLVAATDAPSGADGALGNATTVVNVGDSGSTAVGYAALLAGNGGTGCTIGRAVTVQLLAAGKSQTATLGGANTAGVSYFTGTLSIYRDVILQAATGGTVVFGTGTWSSHDKAFTVGSDGNLGTVSIANVLSTTGGVAVAYGTLAVNGSVASAVSVASNAVLTGTGRIVTNGSTTAITVASGGTLDPGTAGGIGTLTVTGNVAFASGSWLAVQADAGGADLLAVTGTVTAAGTVNVGVQATAGQGPWRIMSAASIDPAFVAATPGFAVSLKNGAKELWLNRVLGSVIAVR